MSDLLNSDAVLAVTHLAPCSQCGHPRGDHPRDDACRVKGCTCKVYHQ